MTIVASISMGDYSTTVHGENIVEVLQKIVEYHTMNEYEKEHYTNKGNLEEQLNSGWYLQEGDFKFQATVKPRISG